jgi:phage terminase large subunit-like protein
MLGVAPYLDQVRRHCLDAQLTPGLEAEFRVKVCSEWQNAGSAWLSLTAWDRCAVPSLRLEQFAGRPCWIGGDLAPLDDLAAVALLFEQEDALVGFVRCYLPAGVVAERARAVPEYRRWVEDGLLVVTEGTMTDYSRIETDVRGWCQQFQVRDICLDQFGAVQLTGNLFNSGLPARMEPKNTKTCTPPAREFETRLKHRRFAHDGNSCLRWQASNVVVTRRGDETLLPQKESPTSPNKIDAIDALLSAIGGWLRTAAAEPSYAVVVCG